MTFACCSLLITVHARVKHMAKQSIICKSSQVKAVKSFWYYWTTPSKGHSVSLKQGKPISHTLLLILTVIVGNARSQNVINIWWPFPWRTLWLAFSCLHCVCVTNDSYEVYYVNEIYEDSLGLSMKKWPSGAEKHNFIGSCSSPWK